MTEEDTQVAKQLPDPKGYKLLIALPEPEEMTEGGILKARETMQSGRDWLCLRVCNEDGR